MYSLGEGREYDLNPLLDEKVDFLGAENSHSLMWDSNDVSQEPACSARASRREVEVNEESATA